MRTYIHNAWLHICGETGATLISCLALVTAAQLLGTAAPWLLPGMIGLVILRFIVSFTKQHRSVLHARLLRVHVKAMFSEEVAVSVAFVATCVAMNWPIERATLGLFIGLNFAAQAALLTATRSASRWITSLREATSNYRFDRHAVIAGTGPQALRVADAIMKAPELGTHLLGFLDYHKSGFWRFHDVPLLGHPDRLERIIIDGQVDAIFMALEPEDIPLSAQIFRVAEKTGVDVYVMASLYRPRLARLSLVQFDGFPAMVYRTTAQSQSALLLKGLIDKLGALVGIILTGPIMLAVAIAVKWDSPGPVLFRQTRSGLNGRRFNLYKFRSMCTDADALKHRLQQQNEMSGPVFKIKNDPRITKLGKFLRKYSIDELPQLFNVLKGDMSLVGPRPPLPEEVTRFEAWQRRKLSVKPGLTCLWQVNGRNQIDFEDWMQLDLQYIDNWSLLLDAKILAKTVPTVLKGSGL